MNKESYDLGKFEKPSVTVDIVIFTIRNSSLEILLVKRGIWPFKNHWALPGGFVGMKESLDEAAKRELVEETGVENIYLEQLYTFGELNRDPRTRVITVSYFALIDSSKMQLKAGTDVSDAKWFSVKKLPKLAFDHKKIIDYAIQRLGWKIEYTTAAYALLQKSFTLGDMQKVYETILDKKIDKRNFRKKILSLNILYDTKKMICDKSHRPAKLYSFKKPSMEIVDIL